MKKKIFITLLAISMLGTVGCGQISKAAEKELTQTVESEATTVDEDIYSIAGICAEIESISTVAITVTEDVTEAESFEELQEAAKKFSDLKNEYLNVMVECEDEAKLADVKQQLFVVTKAIPTSIKEDTAEEKESFIEKSNKLVEAVNKLSETIYAINN